MYQSLITKPCRFQFETIMLRDYPTDPNHRQPRLARSAANGRAIRETQESGPCAMSGCALARFDRRMVVAPDRARRPDGQAPVRRISAEPGRRPQHPRGPAQEARRPGHPRKNRGGRWRPARIRLDRPGAGARHGAARAAALGRQMAVRGARARGAGRSGERGSDRARAADAGRPPRAPRRSRAAAQDISPREGAEHEGLRTVSLTQADARTRRRHGVACGYADAMTPRSTPSSRCVSMRRRGRTSACDERYGHGRLWIEFLAPEPFADSARSATLGPAEREADGRPP